MAKAKNQNLTTKQLTIIDQLTAEFVKLNTIPEKKNSLIDFGTIIQSVQSEDNFEKQCKLEENAFTNMVLAQRKVDAESLNDDLRELGLTTFIRPNYWGFYIIPIGSTLDEAYHDYVEIKVDYKTSHNFERKLNKLTRNISAKYCVGIQTRNYSYSDRYFATFQEFLKSENFKTTLQSTYKRLLKLKK